MDSQVLLKRLRDPINAKILEFNYAFGVIPSVESAFFPRKDPETLRKARSLIESEITELKTAAREQSVEETIDALGDIAYLIIGFAVRLGIYPREVFVQKRQKTKTHATEEEIAYVSGLLAIMCVNVEEQTISRYLAIVYEFINDRGVDYYEVMSRIHDSNMQKFACSEEHARESAEYYLTYATPTGETYTTPSYRLAADGQRWVIFDIEKNKVLKAKGWQPPNFDDLLEK